MNRQAMTELASHLERMPEAQFNMTGWAKGTGTATLQRHEGVTCCIAGEKILLDGGTVEFDWYGDPTFTINDQRVLPEYYVATALGLDANQQWKLFFSTFIETPQQAAQKIREMLDEQDSYIGASGPHGTDARGRVLHGQLRHQPGFQDTKSKSPRSLWNQLLHRWRKGTAGRGQD